MDYPIEAIEEIVKYAVYQYQLYDKHEYGSAEEANRAYNDIATQLRAMITHGFENAKEVALDTRTDEEKMSAMISGFLQRQPLTGLTDIDVHAEKQGKRVWLDGDSKRTKGLSPHGQASS